MINLSLHMFKRGVFMLLKLIFTKEKLLFYKIKIKNEKDFWVATAPYPKIQSRKKD